MAKRKVEDVEEDAAPPTRRSNRRKTSEKQEPVTTKTSKSPNSTNATGTSKPIKVNKTKTSIKKNSENLEEVAPASALVTISSKPMLSSTTVSAETQQYWLMKAEPESRLERGHDIKFSIDDLAAKKVPEPWDGIRAYAARNNLRAMKKGDLAFFYHSSCKVPAIVGIMEIVREHSPDLSAQDPKAPYYDAKDSDSSNPRWSVVHVEFRRKFKNPITLKDLKDINAASKELADMQMLKQSRLSVSKVSKHEWDFLMSISDQRESDV